ncbi:MAG: cobalamin biosynthesis protein [Methanosarcinaceae archaeon]|nr:cobalamin biosynthesis protein [Methanosarcinaceae archaeon]
MIMGIGTRRGVEESEVLSAIFSALKDASLSLTDIECFSSSELKSDESGLLSAICRLGSSIYFLPDDALNECDPVSPSKASRFGLKGVAEPAALALSKNKKIIFPKKVYGRVTIAIAE